MKNILISALSSLLIVLFFSAQSLSGQCSDTVIKAMKKEGLTETQIKRICNTADALSIVPKSSDQISKIQFPKVYGVYLVSNGKILDLSGGLSLKGRFKGIGSGSSRKVGIKTLSGIAVSDKKSHFILYYKNVMPSKFQLAKLKFVKDLNMWIKESVVPTKIAPIEGKNDMYRLIPAESLPRGVFALYAPADFSGVLEILGMLEEAIVPNSVYGFLAFCDFALK